MFSEGLTEKKLPLQEEVTATQFEVQGLVIIENQDTFS